MQLTAVVDNITRSENVTVLPPVLCSFKLGQIKIARLLHSLVSIFASSSVSYYK